MKALIPITIILVILGIALGFYQKEKIAEARRQTARLNRYRDVATFSYQSISNTLERLIVKHATTTTHLELITKIKNDVISNIPIEITSRAKPKSKMLRENSNKSTTKTSHITSSAIAPAPIVKPVAKRVNKPKHERVEQKPRNASDAPEGMMTREQLEAMRKGTSKKQLQKKDSEGKSSSVTEYAPKPVQQAAKVAPVHSTTASLKSLTDIELENKRKELFATVVQEQAMDAAYIEKTVRTATIAVQKLLIDSARKAEKTILTTLPSRARAEAKDLIFIRKEAKAKEALVDSVMADLPKSMELAVSVQKDLHEMLTRDKEKKNTLQKEAEQRIIIANQLSDVRRVSVANAELIKGYKLDKALAVLKQQLTVTNTEPALTELNILIDRCARLQLLKKFVIERLTEVHFRFGWKQTGNRRDIVGADDKVIKVSGEDVPWVSVDYTQMASIMDHCIADAPVSRMEIGRLRLAMAVWSQEHDRKLEGKKYGDIALEVEEKLRGEHKRLFDQYRLITHTLD